MAIDTLLFDLDGTLVDQTLPGSELEFTWLVLRRFWRVSAPHRTWIGGKAAAYELQNHRSDRTNFEAMVAAFCRHTGVAPAEAERLMLLFAEQDFARMGWRFKPIPGAREALTLGRELGFRLVLATNPTVPLPMTMHRLRWAGLDDVAWAYVTHPQIMTRTKPDVGYYHELLAKLEAAPEQCLMIGNDFRKDLPAMAAGIRTFLLDRPMSGKALAARGDYEPDHFGSYEELCRVIRAIAAERDARVRPA